MSITPLQNQALDILEKIHEREKLYDKLNKNLRELQGDFAAHFNPIEAALIDPIVILLDEILGDRVASYFLFEGGGHITEDGKEYRIQSVEDVRAFVGRKR